MEKQSSWAYVGAYVGAYVYHDTNSTFCILHRVNINYDMLFGTLTSMYKLLRNLISSLLPWVLSLIIDVLQKLS